MQWEHESTEKLHQVRKEIERELVRRGHPESELARHPESKYGNSMLRTLRVALEPGGLLHSNPAVSSNLMRNSSRSWRRLIVDLKGDNPGIAEDMLRKLGVTYWDTGSHNTRMFAMVPEQF